MARALSPSLWLHATSDTELAVLQVLDEHLADLPDAPPRIVTSARAFEADGLEGFIREHRISALVLPGAAVPADLVERVHKAGVAVFLVDTPDAIRTGRWTLIPGQLRGVLSHVTAIHARSAQAAATLARQVSKGVEVIATGPLARRKPAQPTNRPELEFLRGTIGPRPVWLACDATAPEIDPILLAHAHALRQAHRLLLILSVADEGLGRLACTRARDIGLTCAQRTLEDEIDDTTQVYVADAGDEPGLFMRLSQVTVLGGTLSGAGHVCRAEDAAALGSAIVFGPRLSPSETAFLADLQRAGGAVGVQGPAELGEAVTSLLVPEAGAIAALRAWTLATEGSDATHAVATALCRWFAAHEVRP
ncbi:MAG: hypothetical protein R3D60_08615 [Paracoccaceae bacterium]